MKYDVLMNDFQSPLVPEFLYGIIDTQKRLDANGELQGSPYSFPYYLKDDRCPAHLLLICEASDENLSFDYYKIGMGHIVSDKFLQVINALNCSQYISKKLIAIYAKEDIPIRSDLNYIYFLNNELLIDEASSKLEEDKFGNLIPHTLSLNGNASSYDVFTINKTLLSGYLILSNVAKDVISKSSLEGIKTITLDNAFKHHCNDYHYDLELSRKPQKKRIP